VDQSEAIAVTETAWGIYVVAAIVVGGYFILARRRFDFLAIACIGALFYFSPLFWGWVFQAAPDLPVIIQPVVYYIATIYLMSLAGAALLWRGSEEQPPDFLRPGSRLSQYYLVLSFAGLVGSLVTSRGEILNPDKLAVLSHVGHSYVLFEVAAALACVSSVIERRRWELAGSVCLLFIDLLVGFRVFVSLAALSVTLILLMRDGQLNFYKKLPIYGSAAAILLAAMLLATATRIAVFSQAATFQAHPNAQVADAKQMQHDGIERDKRSSGRGQWPSEFPAKQLGVPASNWSSIAFRIIRQSGEPFVVQGPLVAVVHTGLSCKPSNILKSLFLLVPPGMARFAPRNSFPPTFFDEYQPILYPNIAYGTGANIWAEMLCRFGYVGLIVFGALLILTLLGLNKLLLGSNSATAAPLALGGTIIAFYIHRNDLHFTLQMLKWVATVFVAAYVLSLLTDRMKSLTRSGAFKDSLNKQ
jgi:hypothetical protein